MEFVKRKVEIFQLFFALLLSVLLLLSGATFAPQFAFLLTVFIIAHSVPFVKRFFQISLISFEGPSRERSSYPLLTLLIIALRTSFVNSFRKNN